MKTYHYIYLVLSLLFSFLHLHAQGQNLKAHLELGFFTSPVDGSYVEAQFAIEANSLEWKKVGSKFQSETELNFIILKDSLVVNFAKELIKNQLDSAQKNPNLMLFHGVRLALPSGNYNVLIKLDDLNDSTSSEFIPTSIKVPNYEGYNLSSVLLFTKFSKEEGNTINHRSGYLIERDIFHLYGAKDTVVYFYSELYQNSIKADTLGKKYLKWSLQNLETGAIEPNTTSVLPIKSDQLVTVFSKPVNLKELSTGIYGLNLEVVNSKNNIICSESVRFQVIGKTPLLSEEEIRKTQISQTFASDIHGVDTLLELISSFRPISSQQEKDFAQSLRRENNEMFLQQYVYHFWAKRNPLDPMSSFIGYIDEVEKVNKAYGNRIVHGYDTDRGRVYLQYGAPNTIVKEGNDPQAYPYEIWHYYSVRGQSNIRFIFSNTDLATNDFRLIHSTATGEVYDPRWRLQLRKRNEGYQSIDENGNTEDDWGSQFNKYFEDPR